MKLIRKPIIFLLGPTATGKTEWAINWHNQFKKLEIISVDSVMVYKECNVGSAKPSNAILKKKKHHLINHVSLNEIFSVANFYDSAHRLIQKIHSKNKIPLMVGGSMMYFNLLKKGISTLPPANKILRQKLQNKIQKDGVSSLHKDLCRLDQKAAKDINPQDSQRIIRAIEIITLNDKSLDISIAESKKQPLKENYNLIEYGIFPKDRRTLHQRIEERQESLVGEKLLNEIKQIQENFKISQEHPAMKAINYRQGLQVLNGEIKTSDLFEKSLYATRQLAKRQCTWMRGWEDLKCFDINMIEDATNELKKQLNLIKII